MTTTKQPTPTAPTRTPFSAPGNGAATPARGLSVIAGTRDYAALPHGCRCGTRWSGSSTAHCAANGCHQTFTGITAFDAHRSGGHCQPPAKVGLALVTGRAYPCWGNPADTPKE